MLTHQYQNWYSRYLGLSETESAILVATIIAVAGLSALNPEFAKSLGFKLVRQIKRPLAKLIRRFKRQAGDGVWLGDVFISDLARLSHTWILGSTGYGKTVFLEHLIKADIERGLGMVIVDPKGDRKLYERVRQLCKDAGRERDLHLMSATYPNESVRWNPCALGNPSELKNKWLNSGVYENPFYATAAERALQEGFTWLNENQPDGFNLSDLLKRLEVVNEQKKNDHIEGLFNELTNFSMSQWRDLLCVDASASRAGPKREVTLWDIVRKKEILFLDLPTESSGAENSRVGKLFLQEFTLVSGLRKAFPDLVGDQPFSVFVDEFDAFASPAFGSFLNKGRSSNLMIHMAHQTLADLDRVASWYRRVINGNCNVNAVFRMNNADEAELIAKNFGTKQIVKKTFQTSDGMKTGMSSNRETEEFCIHPNQIKSLKVGECVLNIKPQNFAAIVKVPFVAESKKPKSPAANATKTESAKKPMIRGVTPANSGRPRKNLKNGVEEYSSEYAGLMKVAKTVKPNSVVTDKETQV